MPTTPSDSNSVWNEVQTVRLIKRRVEKTVKPVGVKTFTSKFDEAQKCMDEVKILLCWGNQANKLDDQHSHGNSDCRKVK